MEGMLIGFAWTKQRHVYADEVCLPQRLVKRHVLDPRWFFIQAMAMAQILDLLDGSDKLLILIDRVVAQDVHVEPGALLYHRQSDAPGADHGNRLTSNLIAQEWQVRMPVSPLVVANQMLCAPELACERAHDEECELRGGFRQHVWGVRKWDLVAVGIRAIDVVESHSELRDSFQRLLPCFEDFLIDGIAQGRDQA